MKFNTIGRSNVKVSAVAFGCASIGNLGCAVSDQESNELLRYAWSQGIRYFDTAPHYGRGLSEQRLGRFLRALPRDTYTISSKVGRVLSPGPDLEEADGFLQPLPMQVVYDYSGDGIEAAFEQSCERLGTTTIDIIFVHDIGEYTHGQVENIRHMNDFLNSGIDRLQHLKTTGRIRAFGLGVNENRVCLDVLQHTPLDVILLAGRLTLLDRSAEVELVARCRATKTSLVLGGVFNSGILATGAKPGATFDYAPASPEVLTQVQELETRAATLGISLATAALHYAAKHPLTSSLLLGTGKKPSLKRNLDALASELPLGAEQLFDFT